MHDVDYVVHAAALKQVDTAEYNPFEYVQTNIVGSQNVVEAAIDAEVKKVVALSTDKASSPLNLYGATKLAADKLFQSANHYAAGYETRFSVVRYGNVMGSRGSVIPFFKKLAEEGKPLPITDLRMTRFFITLPQAVEFVNDSFDLMQGGELYVPRIPSMKIIDLVEAVAPGCRDLRDGHPAGREAARGDDLGSTTRAARCASATGTSCSRRSPNWGFTTPDGEPLPDGFAYRSDTNDQWLDAGAIRDVLETID